MQALSIKQPWAYLVAHGIKDIENRTWTTQFRGEFLIHASKTFDMEGYHFLVKNQKKLNIPLLPLAKSFKRGGIVGKAKLIDCAKEHNSIWFSGPNGFVLADAIPIEFHECRGHLRFFEINSVR